MSWFKDAMEWLLGIPHADPGQGTAWRYVHEFPWPSWVLVLFSLGASAYVLSVYRRDAGHRSRGARVVLAGLRMAALGLLLFMLSQAMLSVERTGLPFVVVMLDVSGSMATEDLPAESEAREFAERLMNEAGLEKPSRLNRGKALLLRENGRLVRRLIENHKLRVYSVAEAGTLVGGNAYLEPAQLDELLSLVQGLAVQGDQTRLGDSLRDVLGGLR